MIWLAKSGIKGIGDLRGKTIATAGIPYQDAYLKTILARANLSPDDVKTVNVGFGLLPAIVGGKADAMLGGFSNVEGVDLRLRGKDPVVTPVDQLGVPTYDELVLVANREQPRRRPASRIRLFLAALARGTAAAVKSPERDRRSAARSQPRPRPEADRGGGDGDPAAARRAPTGSPTATWTRRSGPTFIAWMRDNGLIASAAGARARCSATPTCRARSPNSAATPSREQAGDLLGRQRPREEVALRVVAAEAAQLGELGLVLDPLGDHVERERPGHADDRLDDRRPLLLDAERVDERAVDLQRVEGEAVEVGERGVAGAEVVEDEAHAELAERLQGRPVAVADSSTRTLSVISSRRWTGSRPVRARISRDRGGEVAVGDLAGGEVDRDVERPLVGPLLVPLEDLAAGASPAPSGRSARSGRSPRRPR